MRAEFRPEPLQGLKHGYSNHPFVASEAATHKDDS